jgi:glycosyltransferase involved in cell wall biosynthesis
MKQNISIPEQFEAQKACVLIPTYNNAATLAQVIRDVLAYTHHIIVVIDGSTDNSTDLVKAFPQAQLVQYAPNQGKGWALRQGFAHAITQGYRYAITIDSDGQHYAKDLPVFLDKIEQEPDALLIGARNMNQDSVPGKSSFGNKFSNFWFQVETGIKGPDTQSGYRLYPLQKLKGLRFITRKYEFEIEVLVRASWKGVKIDWVPVTVYYPPAEERISHFRPFKDFFRISVLNTVLVLITFLYIKPRDFFRGMFNKEKRKAFIQQLLHPAESDQVKAVSVGFGVFMGIVPIWGFQLVVAIFLAILFKLNKALVIVAANISIPPLLPFILLGSYWMGAYWMGNEATHLSLQDNINLKTIHQNFTQYLYGSVTLALTAGVLAAMFSYLLIKIVKRKPTVAA